MHHTGLEQSNRRCDEKFFTLEAQKNIIGAREEKDGETRLVKNVLQVLEEKVDGLTFSKRKAADYILKNPTEAAFLTIEQLSGHTGVSVATIMRLAYELGYSGYSHFQKDLQEVLRNRVAPSARFGINLEKVGKNKLLLDCAETQINNIQKTVSFITDEEIEEALALITNARRVYVIGLRWSQAVANYLNDGLLRLGVDCELLVPESARMQTILANLSANDLVIGISLPRYAKRTVQVCTVAKSRGAKILAITDGYSSPLAVLADTFLSCASETLSYHLSQIGVMFVADFLITGIAMKRPKEAREELEKIEKIMQVLESNVLR